MTGRLSAGELRIVGPPACPLRTAMIRSAVCEPGARLNRPHFMIAFSTASSAVRFAVGSVSGSPASGWITTYTVCALSIRSGRVGFFLFLATTGRVKRRRTSNTTGQREDITYLLHRAPEHLISTTNPRERLSDQRSGSGKGQPP